MIPSSDGATESDDKFTISFENICSEEADHATQKAGRGRPKKERRGGFRVGAMKFPLRTVLKEYLEMRKQQVGERTYDNQQRILSALVEEIEAGKIKKLSSTNPYKMKMEDAKAILDYLKGKELENETILRYLQFFNGLLFHCDNHAIEELKKRSPHLFPKRIRKGISYLTEDELSVVRKAAKQIPGWNGSVLRFLTAAYPGTGLRPSELRTAEYDDLDLRNWTLRVRHPKGEGSYGERRVVTVMPPFREDIVQYLNEREQFLSSRGRTSKYLIPRAQNGEDKPYSSNYFRVLKKQLVEATGIEFRLKDFRSTFASLTVKKDPNSLPDVSKQLGHSSLVVTQNYYASIEANDSGRRLSEVWEQNSTVSAQENKEEKVLATQPEKNVLIKPKEYLSGYA